MQLPAGCKKHINFQLEYETTKISYNVRQMIKCLKILILIVLVPPLFYFDIYWYS